MIPLLVYPVPLDTPEVWELFKPCVQRFCDTWRQHPPGCEVELLAIPNNGDTTNELLEMFDGLPVTWMRYDGMGADAGSWQFAAKKYPGRFMVGCNTRTYFHRRGWLNHIVHFREEFGPGLYATSASHEGGRIHACIRTVGIDTDILNAYPVEIVSRDQGCFFEIGRDNPDGPLSEWASKKGVVKVVLWSGCFCVQGSIEKQNSYRHGTQLDCLVFDKHTQAFQEASPQEKERLFRIMVGETASSGLVPKQ